MFRNLVTIDDLSEHEIQALFRLADEFLDRMADPARPHRVRGRTPLAQDFVLATLFYEASTRTRFSFESAMIRLGGHVLSSADPKTTSAAKGETLADTIRIVEAYADVVVIRHPSEGAVRVAADYSDIPVINGGDGGHEHPTQTLCDLYTLQREKGTLKDLNVMLMGDLKNGRTVHSLVYGLARFGARIIPAPAEGFGLPDHVTRRLLRDYDCVPLTRDDLEHASDDLPVDVVYVTPEKPHQLTLFTDLKDAAAAQLGARLPGKALSKVDACYVTRLQKERMGGDAAAANYPVVDRKFLKNPLYKNSSVLHPLPRVSEIGYDIDNDARAVYFKQASYGVPIRMALIAALLKLRPEILSDAPPQKKHLVYEKNTVACDNRQCVTGLETEQRYLTPRFWVVRDEEVLTLRCMYCEHEMVPACIARTSTRKFQACPKDFKPLPDDMLLFADEAAAIKAGYSPYKQKVHD